MKFKIFKSILSICLVTALLLAPPALSAASDAAVFDSVASQQDAVIKNKKEVIYATLDSSGSANAIYAVNHFEITQEGNITDYGYYSSVENLTSTDQIANNGSSVSFPAKEGNFYYKGNILTPDLPWKFDISYYLDGVKTVPQELADKSGGLKIHIGIMQNEKTNSVFCENYMLQISMTLNTEKCDDIKAPGATIASSGKNTVITYIVMPGKDGDITLTSTVHDFTMSGIQISAMPFNIGIEMPDTGEMVDKIAALPDAINSLNDGVKKLNNGISDMSKGSVELTNGSAKFKYGLSQLSGNSTQLTQASSQIYSALTEIIALLNDPSVGIDLSALTQLPEGLNQLAQGLSDIQDSLTQLKSDFADANSALNSAIANIPDISQSDIESLSNSSAIASLDEGQRNTFNQLLLSYTAAQTVKTAYYGPSGNDGIKATFDLLESSLNTITGSINTISQSLSDMSSQISDADIGSQIQQLIDGLTALSNNYGQFNLGLIEYTNGVKDLSSNYESLHAGLVSLSDGTADLYEGMKKLYAGSNELNEGVSNFPETMQAEIDNLMKDYDKSDFKPVSFVSEKNTNVSLVQFVFKTAGIESNEETAKTSEPATEKATLWDRFLALFG